MRFFSENAARGDDVVEGVCVWLAAAVVAGVVAAAVRVLAPVGGSLVRGGAVVRDKTAAPVLGLAPAPVIPWMRTPTATPATAAVASTAAVVVFLLFMVSPCGPPAWAGRPGARVPRRSAWAWSRMEMHRWGLWLPAAVRGCQARRSTRCPRMKARASWMRALAVPSGTPVIAATSS